MSYSQFYLYLWKTWKMGVEEHNIIIIVLVVILHICIVNVTYVGVPFHI